MNDFFKPLSRFSLLVLMVLMAGTSLVLAQSAPTPEQASAQVNGLSQQLTFERNTGQMDAQFQFMARDRQATYFFMTSEVRTVVNNADATAPFAYSMKFVGARAGAKPIGIGNSSRNGQQHVLEGSQFIKNIPQHEQLRYPNLWDNIHAYFAQSEEGLKYDFVVNPGGNPASIAFELEGVTNVRVTPEGELAFSTPFGELRKGRPYTYQNIDGNQVEVPSQYVVRGNVISFQVGAYDAAKQLIIDPVALKWATVLGGGESFCCCGILL
jgi:hypothetical protein